MILPPSKKAVYNIVLISVDTILNRLLVPFVRHNRLTPHECSIVRQAMCSIWLARPRSLESLRAHAVAWTDSYSVLYPAVVRAAPTRIVLVADKDGYWSHDIHPPQNINKWTHLSKIFMSKCLLCLFSRKIYFVSSFLFIKESRLMFVPQNSYSSRLYSCPYSFSTVLPSVTTRFGLRCWKCLGHSHAVNKYGNLIRRFKK